jgi:hypothetical protein
MKLDSIDSAIQDYERITGELFDIFNPDLTPIVLPSNEFLLYQIGERDGMRYFEINQTYGYVRNFTDHIKIIMEENKLSHIVTFTQRNPKYHIRKYKLKRLPQYDYDYEGRHYYCLIGNLDGLLNGSKWEV